ncbi:hypothetical protein BH18THE2_BH18THE2_07770 [soil metagenome]
MPSKISTVIGNISGIPNEANKKCIYKFYDFMHENDTSQNYQRGNLIVIIAFAKFLGELRLSEVQTVEPVITFLDSRKRDLEADPDKIWIRTWND